MAACHFEHIVCNGLKQLQKQFSMFTLTAVRHYTQACGELLKKIFMGEEVGANWGSSVGEGGGCDRRWEKQLLMLSACLRLGNSGSDKETVKYHRTTLTVTKKQ